MELTTGEWSILPGGTELVGVAYSVFFDQDGRSASCVLRLKPLWVGKKQAAAARVHIVAIRQRERVRGESRPMIDFEGLVRSWNGHACAQRRISGWLSASDFQGICHIHEHG